MYGLSDSLVKQIVAIAEQHEIGKLVLFGSRARGDFRANSDIAVLFKVFCKSTFRNEVRDFKIPEPEAVSPCSVWVSASAAPAAGGGLALTGYR